MFIWSTRLSKKKLVVGSVLIIGVLAAVLSLPALLEKDETPAPLPGETNAQRVEYLRTCGWEVVEEPVETFQFLLPEKLEEPYASYNELQLSQGFDLRPYCGRQLARYTYTLTNYPDRPEGVQANLYVCDGQIVGGDVFCPGDGGFQEALISAQ